MTTPKGHKKRLREHSDTELWRLKFDLAELQERIGKLGASTKSRLQSVHQEIKRRERSEEEKLDLPIISDHAMVRYFERVLGYDLEVIEQQIQHNIMQGEAFLCENLVENRGIVYVVRNNRGFVKTILTKEMVTEDTIEQSKDRT